MRNHFIDHPLLGGLIQRALGWIGHAAVVINAQGAMEGRAVVLGVAAVGIICHTVEYFECQCLIDIILRSQISIVIVEIRRQKYMAVFRHESLEPVDRIRIVSGLVQGGRVAGDFHRFRLGHQAFANGQFL